MIRKLGSHVYVKVAYALDAVKNQRGAQAIEYVAVAGIIVALLLAIKTAMTGEKDAIAGDVVKKLKEWLTNW
jgi:Flp pilus assembly pilin Flp